MTKNNKTNPKRKQSFLSQFLDFSAYLWYKEDTAPYDIHMQVVLIPVVYQLSEEMDW